MHSRHGELLQNGYHVGDLVSSPSGRTYGVVVPHPDYAERWGSDDRTLWARWAPTEEAAALLYAEGAESSRAWNSARNCTLIRSYEGSSTMTEPVEFTFYGEELRASQRATEIREGEEYRLIYCRDHHNMELTARAIRSYSPLRTTGMQFTVTGWPRPRVGEYDLGQYPVGARWSTGSNPEPDNYSYNFILPMTPAEVPAADSNYAGEPGAFVPHDGQIPESGTVVRAMTAGNRQYEGLFLRVDTGGAEAIVEAKRYRDKRGGEWSDWTNYQARQRRTVLVAGAEIFKPGAASTHPEYTRGHAITDREQSLAITEGTIISGTSGARRGGMFDYYRGAVLRDLSDGEGEWAIRATHKAVVNDSTHGGAYIWVELETPEEKHVLVRWEDGRNNRDRGGYVWTVTQVGGAVKRVDPAYDPKRKTPHTGMKIGDLVVGLMQENEYGRDTVASWVRGELIKWDVRYGRPIVKVTDKMESAKEVGDEVAVVAMDVYPALADPTGADPEEFKKTLRDYLIGRHKRSDFCRGGLNTMLAAFGLPLYETKRRAQMVVTVEYDPNTTDLYNVQTNLRRQLPGVQGLSFEERSGEEIELTIEQDRTAG